jgi:hypothetical protein
MSFEFKKQNDFINLDNILEKALKKQIKSKVAMDDFREIYGNRQVDYDLEEVAIAKANFEKSNKPKEAESKKLATILEVILGEQAELSNWLGENAETVFTSDYDDLKGTDMIVEFSEEEKNPTHLGLAIDATYSSDLENKFINIKKSIKNEELSTIKYFSSEYFTSPNMDFKGRLSQVPKVVVGVDNQTIEELIELWYTNKKNKYQELANHPVQFQILEEIEMQLETFEKYAMKIGKDDIAKKYRITKNFISEILKQRKSAVKDTSKRDKMLDNIKNWMSYFED